MSRKPQISEAVTPGGGLVATFEPSFEGANFIQALRRIDKLRRNREQV
jgi:hypothetical protein